MSAIKFEESSGDVFRDIGFDAEQAEEMLAKSTLVIAIEETIERRDLTTAQAAKRCKTDVATLRNVFRGRIDLVTIDILSSWLTALGRTVEIRVQPFDASATTGRLVTIA